MPIPDFVLALRKHIGHALLPLPGVCAIVLNEHRQVLLQYRGDLNQWTLLGGILEPGEEPADGVVREVREESALYVEPIRITGVYTTPIIKYPNGDLAQYTITAFLCRPTPEGQIPQVNDDESIEMRYFDLTNLPELRHDHTLRLQHALDDKPSAFFHRTVV